MYRFHSHHFLGITEVILPAKNPSYKLQTGKIALLCANEQNYKSTDQTYWILSNYN